MSDLYFPPPPPARWEEASPASCGWSAEGLEDVARYCESQASRQLIVLQSGRIVLERYWDGSGPDDAMDVASAQKSVVSLMLAALACEGRLSMEDTVSRWLGRGWSRAEAVHEEHIRLRHLSSMTSGLYDDFTVEAEPGASWYYNNNAYHQLRKVIETCTGASTQEAFDRLVAEPLGMVGTRWVPRPAMVDPNGWVLSGLYASVRHLARVGLLVLGGGSFGSQPVLDPAVLRWSLSPSQALNPSYGHLWWLPTQPFAVLPGGEITDPRKSFGGMRVDHPLVGSGPADLVAAFGAGDKRLYASPGDQVVVARLGPPTPDGAAGRSFDEHLWRLLSAART